MKLKAELENLKFLNRNKEINIGYKRNKSGSISLYLDYRDNGKRTKEALGIILTGDDKFFQEEKESLKLAIGIRDKRENHRMEERLFGKSTSNLDADFILYFKSVCSEKKHDSYDCSLKKYMKYVDKSIVLFSEIDRSHCKSFARYLEQDSTIMQNTAVLYFKKFKAVLNLAIQDEFIEMNPARDVTIKPVPTQREFLNIDEIKILASTPMQKQDTKNAFLFACFSGLRLSDLQRLRWNDITNDVIYVKQKKTGEPLRIKLSISAKSILEKQPRYEDERIFHLSDRKTVAQVIKRWIKRSTITKKITFHCSRHTFATMLLTQGADIYAVSKLIGHKDLQTTQIYAKLVDERKDEAIDLLPIL